VTWIVAIPGVVVALAGALLSVTPLVDRRRQRALRRTLADVCRAFEAHAIEYWCDFGTLLGFHRERDIILSDKDADLSIVIDQKPRIMALAGELAAAGYDLTDRGGRSRRVIRIRDRRTGYYVDVYTYEREGMLLRSQLVSPNDDIPWTLVARRIHARFLGTTVTVPENVEAVLTHRYGPDFGTPRRGDKGATRPYSVVRSLLEDLQDNALGLWSWLRTLQSR
jgi:hypothetical protein